MLLGLTPTALSLLGNQTVEIALLLSRRPLLSFLMAFGAPVIAPYRAFGYSNPLEDLRASNDAVRFPTLGARTQAVVSTVEYVIILGAGTTIMCLAYEISTKSTYVPSYIDNWHPYLWTYLAPAIHLLGLLAFATRVRVMREDF